MGHQLSIHPSSRYSWLPGTCESQTKETNRWICVPFRHRENGVWAPFEGTHSRHGITGIIAQSKWLVNAVRNPLCRVTFRRWIALCSVSMSRYGIWYGRNGTGWGNAFRIEAVDLHDRLERKWKDVFATWLPWGVDLSLIGYGSSSLGRATTRNWSLLPKFAWSTSPSSHRLPPSSLTTPFQKWVSLFPFHG